MKKTNHKGFTLIELIISVGLFAVIMTLAAGAYLLVIGLNKQTQGVATGINDLSFVLETITRNIRTGSDYCNEYGDLTIGSCSTSSFVFKDASNNQVMYSWTAGSPITETVKYVDHPAPSPTYKPAVVFNVTDSSAETITNLVFTTSGTTVADKRQPHSTILVTGTVPNGPNKLPQQFTIQTGATMRGTDL